MSNSNEPHQEDHVEGHIEEHASLIKTPKQLIVTVVLSFIIPIVVIILLVSWVTSGTKTSAGSDTLGAEATALRIAPVAKIEIIDVNAPRVLQSGQQVYAAACAACHDAGVAGAHKFGDQAAWSPVIATGLDSMINNVIKGKGVMPARGGNPNLDDLEIARAVVYMTNAAGANFEEPAEVVAVTEQVNVAPAPAAMAAPAAPAAVAVAAAEVKSEPAAAPAESAADLARGEQIYKQACMACHAVGVAGAPKSGDKASWGPALATGMDAMIASAIKGKGVMPARGGLASASDKDISDAVHYMVSQLK
jgi:cytochrome c5